MNDRSCHSVAEKNPTNIEGFKSTFFYGTDQLNCAMNPIFRFEMVAVVLCLAVDSYFIYSLLEIDFCKLIKS